MGNQRRILIIDDELPIRRFLKASLPPDEFELIEAASGREGTQMVATYNPAIILLDLGLPDIDGIDLTKQLREWTRIPIIVLSARGQEQDKVAALDSGADDYLTKPFGIGELLARVRVALRHAASASLDTSSAVFETGSLKIDFSTRQVFVNDNEIHLTPLEYKLLGVLVQHAGKVLTHRQLLIEVWGSAYAREVQYLRVFMKQLRHKLEADPTRPIFLTTEPGVGYRFRLAED